MGRVWEEARRQPYEYMERKWLDARGILDQRERERDAIDEMVRKIRCGATWAIAPLVLERLVHVESDLSGRQHRIHLESFGIASPQMSLEQPPPVGCM